MNRLITGAMLVLVCLLGCKTQNSAPNNNPQQSENQPPENTTLAEARKGFKTKLVSIGEPPEAPERPPQGVFDLVKYDAPVGKCSAYLTPDPKNGKKNPAIVWITGGDCNSIGNVWQPAHPSDDQTAAQYRKAGIVMMFPSLRGGNNNPGKREGFFGELDDVVAAADYLAKLDYVDPKRIYLGGHSTGGTLVLLAAAYTDRFRAVFSFGPMEDARSYGGEFVYCDVNNPREMDLRAPIRWLHSVKNPTFVFEGEARGNIQELHAMRRASKSPHIYFFALRLNNHFNLLAPVNTILAQKIVADTGATCNIKVTYEEVMPP